MNDPKVVDPNPDSSYTGNRSKSHTRTQKNTGTARTYCARLVLEDQQFAAEEAAIRKYDAREKAREVKAFTDSIAAMLQANVARLEVKPVTKSVAPQGRSVTVIWKPTCPALPAPKCDGLLMAPVTIESEVKRVIESKRQWQSGESVWICGRTAFLKESRGYITLDVIVKTAKKYTPPKPCGKVGMLTMNKGWTLTTKWAKAVRIANEALSKRAAYAEVVN